MTSTALLERFRSLHPILIDLSLGRIAKLLENLSRPQDKLPKVIHVAGTNGKGSTIAFLRALLEASGQKVQALTSPHLVRFHERIRLSDGLIGEDQLIDVLERCEKANAGEAITYFEITTAAALLAFSEDDADWCLIEVGLGGRYDATNVIPSPEAAVITPVDLDHREYLGDTIAKIAFEKAGIIKPGAPVFVGQQTEEAMNVIESCAREQRTPLKTFGRDWSIEALPTGWRFIGSDVTLKLPDPALQGPHQRENASLALACLQGLNVPLDQQTAAQAMLSVQWPARMQRISSGPLFDLVGPGRHLWLDGGHNAHAARAIAKSFEGQKVSLVFGHMANRDPAEFLEPLKMIAERLDTVPIEGQNAHDPEMLAEAAKKLGLSAKAHTSIDDALKAGASETVLICGSLYLAGDVLHRSGLDPS